MAAKVYFRTFGCKTNQYDSALIGQSLEAAGCELTDNIEGADWVVVNTCAVTKRGEDKARQWVRKVSREQPGAKIAVVGCSVEAGGDRFAAIEGVSLLLGTEEKFRLGEVLDRYESYADGQFRQSGSAGNSGSYLKLPALKAYPGRARGYVKVQDGCDNRCTYCIVPLVRGPGRSREPEEVACEVAELERAGHSEAVITGIHIGRYGRDLARGLSLAGLLERVLASTEDIRLRLSSVEVVELDGKLLELVAEHPRVCRHLHIPLQHGSDRVLEKMGRGYTAREFFTTMEAAAKKIPAIGLGTDIIVGFPGETDEDFRATGDIVKSLPFSYLHVFPYSPRPGTPAAAMKERVSKEVTRHRVGELRRLSYAKSIEFRAQLQGRKLEVIHETTSGAGMHQCRADNYALLYFRGDCPKGKFELMAGEIYEDGVRAELPGA